jgi:hypothetical protein
MRRPFDQTHIRFMCGGVFILASRDAWLMARKGYLARDGIKCLWRGGIVGFWVHTGAGGARGKPKSDGSPGED